MTGAATSTNFDESIGGAPGSRVAGAVSAGMRGTMAAGSDVRSIMGGSPGGADGADEGTSVEAAGGDPMPRNRALGRV